MRAVPASEPGTSLTGAVPVWAPCRSPGRGTYSEPGVADVDDTAQHDLPAGDFSSWLSELQRALRGERSSDVPCDGCTACCKSSQFIHVAPDEADTLAHVPGELLFPAPGLPDGHVLMGYDERGHCPMLIDDRCSIYEHRPRTCRTYDCRVLSSGRARARRRAQGVDLTTGAALAFQLSWRR